MKRRDNREVSVMLPIAMITELDTICHDPLSHRPIYGCRSRIITEALDDWLNKRNETIQSQLKGT